MPSDPAEHHILWHCSPLSSSEHASLSQGPDGYRLWGVAVLPLGAVPCHVEYTVIIDPHWHPYEVLVTIGASSGVRQLALRSQPAGRWELDGVPAPHLQGCGDVDLGWTPATNTIPIRRLGLDVGQSATITAAWVRFPELDIVSNEQCYTRIAGDRWRYRSGDYDFELVTDATTGLVLAYGEDLWRAVAPSDRRDDEARR